MTREPRGKSATAEAAETEEERRGLRPLQLVCLLGAFASTMIALLAFDEPWLELIVVAMGFVVVLVLDAIWRGLTTGKLPYRQQLIDGAREPKLFAVMLLFYVFMAGSMVYFSVDLWTSEL
ncbi:MAG: hypothetical protein KC486_02500 [Myxococcales bacterium]|nr:hypothetical protein [Myxococcales bacterium]